MFLCLSVHLYGQEIPSGHADVWTNVKTYWGLWAQRDLDGFLEYYHDAYSGWYDKDFMHKNKNAAKKWYNHYFKTKEIIVYDINPIDIKIHEEVAIIHYYFSILEKNTESGKEISLKGRKTDVLKWKTDKWLIIASHGGQLFEH